MSKVCLVLLFQVQKGQGNVLLEAYSSFWLLSKKTQVILSTRD